MALVDRLREIMEKEFGIKVPEDELKISNFETMGSIMKMIRILK